MPSPRGLVWYRSDLRTRDHVPLHTACDRNDEVLAVFIATPHQWASHDWGKAKADFVLRGVAALSEALDTLNIPLVFASVESFAHVPQKLVEIAQQYHCETLYYEIEYELNERKRDEIVNQTFTNAGFSIETFETQTIVPPAIVETQAGKPYTVFSPFKRRWLTLVEEARGLSPFPQPKKQPKRWLKSEPVPLSDADKLPGNAQPELWPAGEDEAERRLQNFINHSSQSYKEDRDFPALDGTSSLSPYLAAGMISARTCLTAAYVANANKLEGNSKGIAHWISELVWREFYKHVTLSFPQVCRHEAFRPDMDDIAWQDDEVGLAAWCSGKTGYPLVDAGMRQLAETGWMHNRVRMVTAMFLSKHLLIDWRHGERHFARHLIDLDFASNNGGWQWSASTGTDAAPYFRIFNPLSQSKRFDPEGVYLRQYVPELQLLSDKAIHAPFEAGQHVMGYCEPIVEHAAARQRALEAFKVSE